MEADVGGLARRRDDGGEDVLAAGRRRVDGDVGHPVLLEEAQRVGVVLLVEPARVAELDEHLVATELFLRPLQVLERLRPVDDVRRKLHQDPAELPGRAQRLEGLVEALEDLGAVFARRPLDPAAGVGGDVTQVGRELVDLDRVARHDAERLDVHREGVRRPLGPVRDHRRVGQAVVGGVCLDDVKALGVVAQAVLPGLDALRVPDLRQRLVRPRADSDPDRRSHWADAMRPG